MIDAVSHQVFTRFTEMTLPKADWDHRAHLTVCWVALDRLDPAATLDFLRGRIRRYNEATGVTNDATSGYHETLTEYFVGAVASLDATGIDDVVTAEPCRREAPLRHWTRERLMSPEARAGWVDPDLCPIPWPRVHQPGESISDDPRATARPQPA